jgi:hypothetical protein
MNKGVKPCLQRNDVTNLIKLCTTLQEKGYKKETMPQIWLNYVLHFKRKDTKHCDKMAETQNSETRNSCCQATVQLTRLYRQQLYTDNNSENVGSWVGLSYNRRSVDQFVLVLGSLLRLMNKFYPYPFFRDNCFVVVLVRCPLWREDGSVSYSVITDWSGHWGPMTIHYRLIWDSVPSSSPLMIRRGYGGGILTCLQTGLADLSWKLKLISDGQQAGQSVLVSGTHLGAATNFSFSLKFSLDSCGFIS